MSPGHFFSIYTAEVVKLFRRVTAIVGLVFAALFGILGPILVKLINSNIIAPIAEANQAQPGNPFQGQLDLLVADQAIAASFFLRGLLFLPVLIFILGGLTFASEYQNRTIREYAVRPVPRWALIVLRWLALSTWVAAAALLTFTFSSGTAFLFIGTFEDYWEPLTNLLTCLATDFGFATLALSVAIFTRSVAATIASLVMVFVLQLMTFFGINILNSPLFRDLSTQFIPPDFPLTQSIFDMIAAIAPWQPPFVIGTCGGGAGWQSFLSLGIITLIALLAALFRFQRLDLP